MRLTKENRYLCYSSRHFTYSVPHCLSVSGERTILRCGPEPTTSWTTSLFLMHCCRKSSDWNIHVTENYYCCSLLLHHLYVKYQTGEVVFDHISKHLKKKIENYKLMQRLFLLNLKFTCIWNECWMSYSETQKNI